MDVGRNEIKNGQVFGVKFHEQLSVLRETGRAVIYCNISAAKFSRDLDTINFNYEKEDCGGGSLAPEMWRFTSA